MFSRAINTCVRIHCIGSLTRPAVAVNHATSPMRFFAGWSRDAQAQEAADKANSKKKEVFINDKIPFPNVRLIFQENGESKWELLSRNEALLIAKGQGLDLVLVNAKEDPPICRLENYKERVIKSQMKERENLKKSKHRVLKEFTMGAGIENNDLTTTMNKAKRLMGMGHPVRIIIIAKRQTKKSGVKKYHDNPTLAVEEVALRMLETIEGLPITIQAMDVGPISTERGIDGHIPLITAKKEFILSQKLDKKLMKAKLRKAAELLELDDDPKVKAIKKAEAAAAAAAVAAGGAAAVVGKVKGLPVDEVEEDFDEEDDDDEDVEGELDDDDLVDDDDDLDDDELDAEFDEEDDEEEEEIPEPPPQPKKKSPFDPRK